MYKNSNFSVLSIISLSAVYLILQSVALGQSPALWGASLTCYFDWPMRSLILVAAFACALTAILVGTRLDLRANLRKLTLYVLVPCFLTIIFYLLRVKTHYLGDGLLRSREIEIGLWWLPTEPLAQAANYVMYKLTSTLLGADGPFAVELVSYLGGLFYYYALLGFLNTCVQNRQARLLMFIVLYFSGMTVLFCGYVETYMLIPGLMALFFTFGIRAVRGESSPLAASLLFLLLTLFHFKSLMFAPCVGLLAYYSLREKQLRWAVVAMVTIVAAISAVAILPGLSAVPTLSTTGFMLPFASGESGYTVLSTQHLLDILNQLLLTSVSAVILIIASLLLKRKSPLGKNRSLMFVGAALPGAVAMLFLLHSRLGFAVDWDLFSSATLVVSFFAVMFWNHASELPMKKISTVALASVAFLSFFAFSAVNANSDISIKRQVDILGLYGKEGAIGFESMGNHLNSIGRTDEATQMWRRSIALRPHVRTYANLAQLSLNEGRLTDAKYYAEIGLQLDSTHATLWNHLGVALTRIGDFKGAGIALANAVRFNPNNAYFHHNYAIMLVQTEQWQEAEEQSRQANELSPNDPTILTTLGLALTYTGKLAKAESALSEATMLNPSSGEPYFYLSRAFLLQADTLRARQVLMDYLRNNPGSPAATQMQNELRRLQ